MKKFLIVIITLTMNISINAQTYDKLWTEFQEKQEERLPESAGKVLDKIEKQALKDKNDVQLLKMIIKRCDILKKTSDEPKDTILKYCESYLPKLSEDAQVIVNVEIARLTHDITLILDYRENDFIKTISMEKFAPVFVSEDNADFDLSLEPTLYDYLMHCIIERHEATYYYIENKITLGDLYQELLDFDLENNFTRAYFNNKINQLGEIYGKKDFEKYEELANECPDNELLAKIKIAQIHYLISTDDEQKDYVSAKKYCDDVMQLIDNQHYLYKQCVEFNKSIERKTVDIQMQNVVVPRQPIPVRLAYRNTTNPSYKIYKVSPADYVRFRHLDNEKKFKELFTKELVTENTINTPEETDYKEHSSLIALPPLEIGQYYIIFSNNNSFKNYNDLIFMSLQVSELSCFNMNADEGLNIYILNRETGLPMEGVSARCYKQEYSYKSNSYNDVELGQAVSDKDGLIMFSFEKSTNFLVDLSYGDDVLISNNRLDFFKKNQNTKEVLNMNFYTDRAIYRPGQTVQFKGILLKEKEGRKELVQNYNTLVEFRDSNYQIIDTLTLTTDDYGSVSGSFDIPKDVLNGSFSITNEHGSLSVEVEEYKRPTFEVTFDDIEQVFKIGDSVRLTGKVTALSGFGLDNVKFKYSVTRRTTFPFRFWGFIPRFFDDEVILSGESITLNDGSYNIDFKLLKNEEIKKNELPFYTYIVKIEATSAQGETQTGNTMIFATYNKYVIGIKDKNGNENNEFEAQDLKNMHVSVTNINGKPANTKVECKIFRISDKEKYERYFGEFDRQLLSDDVLDEYFPNFDFYAKKNTKQTIVYQGVIDVNGEAPLLPKDIKIKPAKYIIELKSVDDSLSKFSDEYMIYDLKSKKMPYKSMYWTKLDKTSAQPGDVINYYVGSSEKDVSALVIIQSGSKVVKTERITLNNNIVKISHKVKEDERGRLTFQMGFVRYNTDNRRFDAVDVPFDNMKLNVTLNTKRDKLLPGAEEKWSVTVRDYKNKAVTASLMAGMYDASLDNFACQNWQLYTNPYIASNNFIMSDKSFNIASQSQYFYPYRIDFEERLVFSDVTLILIRYRSRFSPRIMNKMYETYEETADFEFTSLSTASLDGEPDSVDETETETETTSAEIPAAKVRENFNETAFFYPNLKTDEKGNATFTFTMPDALTRWKLRLLTYSNTLSVGNLEKTVVTQKPVMIMADMPRFVYDADTLWVAANVINLSDNAIAPAATLEVFDEAQNKTDIIVSEPVINMQPIASGRSQSVRWKIALRKGLNPLIFRFSAATEGFSDAEQHLLPVLSTDIMMTETTPLTAAAHDVTQYTHDISENDKITFNFCPNPVWYAIQALPYIARDDERSATAAFERYFTNAMALYIVESNPEIAKILENTGDYDKKSELQKYEDLKAILLKETPWVLEAKSEEEQRANITKLFDNESITQNIASALRLLEQKQKDNGGWPWIEGMPESEFVTQYILEGLGKMSHLAPNLNEEQPEITEKAFYFIEKEVVRRYNELDTDKKRKEYHCGFSIVRDLLAMSYFDYETNKDFNKAKDFFLKKLDNDWKHFDFDEQARIALIFNRNCNNDKALAIMQSLREYAVKNKGEIFWQVNSRNLNVEAEARIILAFNEIDPHYDELDMMRLWLLKQKRTNVWDNGTVEAIFAIMNLGTDWNKDDKNISLKINDENIDLSDKPFIQRRFDGSSEDTNFPLREKINIVINNKTEHVTWGGLFRQYFVPVDQVRKTEVGMNVSRDFFIEKIIDNEARFIPIAKENIMVGDKIKVVIKFENSQDMEFVYLKDLRGACCEPTEQLSRYHFDNGLWYYQSTSDVAMEFFFDRLPKGKHEVSHTVYVTKSGSFSAGYAVIQCQYAPEFGAYSAGTRIEIK